MQSGACKIEALGLGFVAKRTSYSLQLRLYSDFANLEICLWTLLSRQFVNCLILVLST